MQDAVSRWLPYVVDQATIHAALLTTGKTEPAKSPRDSEPGDVDAPADERRERSVALLTRAANRASRAVQSYRTRKREGG